MPHVSNGIIVDGRVDGTGENERARLETRKSGRGPLDGLAMAAPAITETRAGSYCT